MTPKEKANELVQWFLNEGLHSFGRYQSSEVEDLEGARFCAEKLADEMLNELDHIPFHDDDYAEWKMKYWQQVKQEIEKL